MTPKGKATRAAKAAAKALGEHQALRAYVQGHSRSGFFFVAAWVPMFRIKQDFREPLLLAAANGSNAAEAWERLAERLELVRKEAEAKGEGR